MSKNKSPLLNETMSEMLPMNLKVSKNEEKVYIPTTIRNRKQHCNFRRFFPYIALFQILMLIILLILYFCFPNLFYSNTINSNTTNDLLQNNSKSIETSSNIPHTTTEVSFRETEEVTEPIYIKNITSTDKTKTNTTEDPYRKTLETQTIIIPKESTNKTIELETIVKTNLNETGASLPGISETTSQVNEELSLTTDETITETITETSSSVPHLRSLPIKSELSMETTDEETDEE